MPPPRPSAARQLALMDGHGSGGKKDLEICTDELSAPRAKPVLIVGGKGRGQRFERERQARHRQLYCGPLRFSRPVRAFPCSPSMDILEADPWLA